MNSPAIGQRLSGRIAIVTGSTEGIGFATAKRLAQEGATVIICSRKQQNVDRAVEQLKSENLKVVGVVCHVGQQEDRQRLFEEAAKLGGLDILVANAGVNPSLAPVLNCDEKAWDKLFEINVKASWLLAKEALPLLKKSKAGKIVFVSSIGAFQTIDMLGAYSVSKTALLGLTKAVAQQLVNDNITVNCVAPGVIETKFSTALRSSEKAQKLTLSKIPMNRFGKIEEVGGTIAFLVSDDASYITGETILVTGGMTSRFYVAVKQYKSIH
nr:dehydrogenase/reductase SDR family member 4 [Epicauta chinensis]